MRSEENGTRAGEKPDRRLAVVLVVLALFAGVLVAKATGGGAATGGRPDERAGETITSTHNDAMADYEAALKTGKPIYVLFHSLT